MKMLIVDDEKLILDGIQAMIDWRKIGVDIAGIAGNGEEALEIAMKVKPDVVVTDIRMPVMDGLGLIKNLKEKLPSTKCIVISGYQEFEYARKAIEYNVAGYVLKPIDADELKNKILDLQAACINLNKEKEKMSELNKKLNESTAFLRNQLLYNLVSGKVKSYQNINERLGYYGIGKLPERYACFIVDMELDHNDGEFGHGDIELIRFAAANIADELVKKRTWGHIFYMLELQIVGLVCIESGQEDILDELLQDILFHIKSFLYATVTIGISDIYTGFENIRISYKEAKSTLRYKTLIGKDKVIKYKEVNAGLENTFNLPAKTETRLTDEADYDVCGAKALIAQIKGYIDSNYSELLTLSSISEKFFINSSYASRLFKKEYSENFIDYLTRRRIEEAKKLLSTTDMKIYEICEKVGYFNSKYFSQIFERASGMSPREYRRAYKKNE